EEIVLPELPQTHSISSEKTDQRPILVAPIPNTRRTGVKSYRDKTKVSKVKTLPSISNADVNTTLETLSTKKQKDRAYKSAPNKVKRKQVTPRQSNVFKRFTLLVIEFVKEKFIWAKPNKVEPDIVSAEHDKRVAENYVFDEVEGIYVSRTAYEKRARFNSDDYKPTKDEITRFPSRPKNEHDKADNSLDLTPSIPPEQMKRPSNQRLRPPGYRK
ncbi:molybdopterin-guanine dinucleotide biosynthesis protein MobA, partial [Salmonella enterica subsp. diarizonae]|nr:molybdopterin-guanine dinucleotide biosynthesis protein MobA [Salmonella enterica subsp. diarizonae]